MEKKAEDKKKPFDPKKRNLLIGAIVVAIGLIIFWLVQQTAPQRSVAAYCQTYKEEKTRLAKLPGDTWPSGVFNDAVSDAGEFAAAFSRLEKVAPDEIHPDVATLQSVYQSIKDNPAGALSASLSGTGAEDGVKQWTKTNCTE